MGGDPSAYFLLPAAHTAMFGALLAHDRWWSEFGALDPYRQAIHMEVIPVSGRLAEKGVGRHRYSYVE